MRHHISPSVHLYTDRWRYGQSAFQHLSRYIGTLLRQFLVALHRTVRRGSTHNSQLKQVIAIRAQLFQQSALFSSIGRVGYQRTGTHLESQVQSCILVLYLLVSLNKKLFGQFDILQGSLEVEHLKRTTAQAGTLFLQEIVWMMVVLESSHIRSSEVTLLHGRRLTPDDGCIQTERFGLVQDGILAVEFGQTVVLFIVEGHTALLHAVVLFALKHQGCTVVQRILRVTVHRKGLDYQSRVGACRSGRDIYLDVESRITVVSIVRGSHSYLDITGLTN